MAIRTDTPEQREGEDSQTKSAGRNQILPKRKGFFPYSFAFKNHSRKARHSFRSVCNSKRNADQTTNVSIVIKKLSIHSKKSYDVRRLIMASTNNSHPNPKKDQWIKKKTKGKAHAKSDKKGGAKIVKNNPSPKHEEVHKDKLTVADQEGDNTERKIEVINSTLKDVQEVLDQITNSNKPHTYKDMDRKESQRITQSIPNKHSPKFSERKKMKIVQKYVGNFPLKTIKSLDNIIQNAEVTVPEKPNKQITNTKDNEKRDRNSMKTTKSKLTAICSEINPQIQNQSIINTCITADSNPDGRLVTEETTQLRNEERCKVKFLIENLQNAANLMIKLQKGNKSEGSDGKSTSRTETTATTNTSTASTDYRASITTRGIDALLERKNLENSSRNEQDAFVYKLNKLKNTLLEQYENRKREINTKNITHTCSSTSNDQTHSETMSIPLLQVSTNFDNYTESRNATSEESQHDIVSFVKPKNKNIPQQNQWNSEALREMLENILKPQNIKSKETKKKGEKRVQFPLNTCAMEALANRRQDKNSISNIGNVVSSTESEHLVSLTLLNSNFSNSQLSLRGMEGEKSLVTDRVRRQQRKNMTLNAKADKLSYKINKIVNGQSNNGSSEGKRHKKNMHLNMELPKRVSNKDFMAELDECENDWRRMLTETVSDKINPQSNRKRDTPKSCTHKKKQEMISRSFDIEKSDSETSSSEYTRSYEFEVKNSNIDKNKKHKQKKKIKTYSTSSLPTTSTSAELNSSNYDLTAAKHYCTVQLPGRDLHEKDDKISFLQSNKSHSSAKYKSATIKSAMITPPKGFRDSQLHSEKQYLAEVQRTIVTPSLEKQAKPLHVPLDSNGQIWWSDKLGNGLNNTSANCQCALPPTSDKVSEMGDHTVGNTDGQSRYACFNMSRLYSRLKMMNQENQGLKKYLNKYEEFQASSHKSPKSAARNTPQTNFYDFMSALPPKSPHHSRRAVIQPKTVENVEKNWFFLDYKNSPETKKSWNRHSSLEHTSSSNDKVISTQYGSSYSSNSPDSQHDKNSMWKPRDRSSGGSNELFPGFHGNFNSNRNNTEDWNHAYLKKEIVNTTEFSTNSSNASGKKSVQPRKKHRRNSIRPLRASLKTSRHNMNDAELSDSNRNSTQESSKRLEEKYSVKPTAAGKRRREGLTKSMNNDEQNESDSQHKEYDEQRNANKVKGYGRLPRIQWEADEEYHTDPSYERNIEGNYNACPQFMNNPKQRIAYERLQAGKKMQTHRPLPNVQINRSEIPIDLSLYSTGDGRRRKPPFIVRRRSVENSSQLDGPIDKNEPSIRQRNQCASNKSDKPTRESGKGCSNSEHQSPSCRCLTKNTQRAEEGSTCECCCDSVPRPRTSCTSNNGRDNTGNFCHPNSYPTFVPQQQPSQHQLPQTYFGGLAAPTMPPTSIYQPPYPSSGWMHPQHRMPMPYMPTPPVNGYCAAMPGIL